jgi:hypothetical protein
MKTRATLAVGLLAVAVAGCGGSGGAQQVRSAFEKTMHELAARNPAACSGFTKRYALEHTGEASYSAALASCRRHTSSGSVSVPSGLRVVKVKVSGDSATVKAAVPGQGTGIFHFLNQNGQWKIDAVTAK